jgi:tetratricopeptide (TPR) repeat protein
MKDEHEILLSMGSIFRISSVEIENNLWIVKLILTEQEDKQIIQLTDYQKSLLREKETVVLLGRHLQDMGENEKAKHYYNLILKDLPEDSIDVSCIYNNLGVMASDEYKYDEALTAFEKSLNISKKFLSEIHPCMVTSYSNIANIYGKLGETGKAIGYYEKALQILFQSLQTNPQPTTLPHLVLITNNLGVLFGRNGNHEQALWYFKKMLEFQLLFLPAIDPTYATTFFNIGERFEQLGNHEQAMIFYEKSLEICNKSLPPNHPQTSTTLGNIGGLYWKASNWSATIKYLEKALEINRNILPNNHPDLIRCYNNLASLYHRLGKDDLAIEMFESALRCTTISDSPSFYKAHTYNNCGAIYFKQGNYAKALENFTKAYEMTLKLYPSEQSYLLMYKENLENAKQKLDQVTAASE